MKNGQDQKKLKMVRILKQPFRLNTNVRVAMFCAMHKFSRENSGTIINAKWLQRDIIIFSKYGALSILNSTTKKKYLSTRDFFSSWLVLLHMQTLTHYEDSHPHLST